MRIEEDMKLDFHNVLIRPKRTTLSSRSQVSLERTMTFPNSGQTWTGVPIIAANMDTTGTFGVYDVLSKQGAITALHKFYDVEDYNTAMSERAVSGGLDPDYYMVSSGIRDHDFERLGRVMDLTDAKWICIDVANGYMEAFVEYCKKVREAYPDKIIVAGNVVSQEMVEELILNGGVDVCKVGIGGGSACTTRRQTGIGMPQLSAVFECADAAHGVGGYIISDGGITCPGDMAKAFCGGADFVMCGGVFSGHDENGGELIEGDDGKQYKLFYGMSSEHAMKKHFGSMAKYRSSEGRVVRVPYRGSLETTVLDYMGGIRSTCTYINASKIKNMPKCATFVRVTQQLNMSLVK